MNWYHPERRDLWRFGGLLALDINNPVDRQQIVTLGEGFTPVLDYTDHPLAGKAGFRLGVKPASAACLGALPALLELGQIRAGDEVVAFNTGSLEKYLPDLRHLLQ